MKYSITNIYWRMCQYPWHFIFNIGFAGLLYFFAIQCHHNHTFMGLGFSDLLSTESFIYYFIETALTFILLFSLIGLFSALYLLGKGIVFLLMGFTFYYWFLFFPLHLIVSSIRNEAWIQPVRWPLCILGIGLLSVLILSLYYFPNRLVKRYFTLKTTKIQERLRIIHLSDIQAENYGPKEASLVNAVNSQNPDIVLISGDTFCAPFRYNAKGVGAILHIFDQLKAKHGILVVGGHHDTDGIQNVVEHLKGKARLLNDEWYELNGTASSSSVLIFGAVLKSQQTDFTYAGQFNRYRIYLAHDPVLLKNVNLGNFDLALFGHTHAGQVYIPGLSRFISGEYRHGLYYKKDMTIYVNAGVGTEGFLSPRIRWFTYPEIVMIDIVPQSEWVE